jgi:hypothetical protein
MRVSPYRRDGHGCQPSGQANSGPDVPRSTTTTVPSAAQPPLTNAASISSISVAAMS